MPATPLGRVIAIFIMLAGAAFMAMPLAIVGTEFELAYAKQEIKNASRDKTGRRQRDLAKKGQEITVQQRMVRAMQLGYKIADFIEESRLQHRSDAGISKYALAMQREIINLSRQLLRDMEIIFRVGIEEIRSDLTCTGLLMDPVNRAKPESEISVAGSNDDGREIQQDAGDDISAADMPEPGKYSDVVEANPVDVLVPTVKTLADEEGAKISESGEPSHVPDIQHDRHISGADEREANHPQRIESEEKRTGVVTCNM